jgi:hypothetical protein
VKETHQGVKDYPYNHEPNQNLFRIYILAKAGKKNRNSLHIAANLGDKEFVTMILHESNDLKILSYLMGEKDSDQLTPFYLLCQQGFKPNHFKNPDERIIIDFLRIMQNSETDEKYKKKILGGKSFCDARDKLIKELDEKGVRLRKFIGMIDTLDYNQFVKFNFQNVKSELDLP